MRWIVGIGLSIEERGALEFATWLQREAGAAIEAVTVVPVVPLPGLDVAAEAELRGEFREVQRRAIEAGDARIDSADVIIGPSTEDVLAARAVERTAGLIVGRTAGRSGIGVPRLGRTARRLLRSLPGPTAVVPSDFDSSDASGGPVLIAITPHPDSLGAATLGRELATVLGREAVLIHAIEPPAHGLRNLPRVQPGHSEAALSTLRAFLAEHSLDGMKLNVREGAAAEAIVSEAEELKPCLVVCGSRRLGLAKRIFLGSTASMTAAVVEVPLLVVPPA